MNHALLQLVKNTLAAALGDDNSQCLLVSHQQPCAAAAVLDGFYTQRWVRTAGPITATAWPDSTLNKADNILLPLPRGKDSLEFCLHALLPLLPARGTLWLFGENDLGIKSANKKLAHFFSTVETVATGGHGRLYCARGPQATVAKPLASLAHVADLPIGVANAPLAMLSYPSLFAGGTLDEGTALLLQSLNALALKSGARVLDYACGIGVIARALSERHAGLHLTCADYDPLALLAAQHNIAGAECVLTATPDDLKGSYDLLVSNPPIHVGAAQSFVVVDSLLQNMPRLLNAGGAALLVAQVTVPVVRLAQSYGLQVAEVSASRSFKVTRLTKA